MSETTITAEEYAALVSELAAARDFIRDETSHTPTVRHLDDVLASARARLRTQE